MGDNFESNEERDSVIEALSGSEIDKEEAKRIKQEKKLAKKQKKLDRKNKKNQENYEDNADKDKDIVEPSDVQESVDASDKRQDVSIDSEADKKKKKTKRKKKRKTKEQVKPEDINIVKDLLSLIIYIGIVVLACYLMVTFVGCRSKVDGSSMSPTLEDGDNLWVDKLAYTIGDPDRYDIIIFNYDEDTTYVKRIIGLPGETVRIDQNGNIFINERILDEDYGREPILPTNIGRASQSILLGEDEYFVLGDNRNNSQDSRMSSVGNVHKDDIVGRALIRIYPFNSFGVVK